MTYDGVDGSTMPITTVAYDVRQSALPGDVFV